MKKIYFILLAAVLVTFFINHIISTFFSSNVEIHRRVRSYFKISQSSKINAEVIRAKISAELPIGSPKEKIDSFLDQTTLGKDRFSVCSKLKSEIEFSKRVNLVCSINLNTDMISVELRRVSYETIFQIDEAGKLKNISVRESITTL